MLGVVCGTVFGCGVVCALTIQWCCRKLMYIVQEMVDTEADYVKSLEYIIEVLFDRPVHRIGFREET